MKFWSSLSGLFGRRKLEAEMAEEMRLHLEILEERNRASGMNEEDGSPQRLAGMRVNAGFFDLFGVKPLLGRFGTAEEDAVGRDQERGTAVQDHRRA